MHLCTYLSFSLFSIVHRLRVLYYLRSLFSCSIVDAEAERRKKKRSLYLQRKRKSGAKLCLSDPFSLLLNDKKLSRGLSHKTF